jgi:zinc transporter ZupT
MKSKKYDKKQIKLYMRFPLISLPIGLLYCIFGLISFKFQAFAVASYAGFLLGTTLPDSIPRNFSLGEDKKEKFKVFSMTIGILTAFRLLESFYYY